MYGGTEGREKGSFEFRSKKPQGHRPVILKAKCTQIKRVGIPCKLVRNGGTWAPPDLLSWKLYECAQDSVF